MGASRWFAFCRSPCWDPQAGEARRGAEFRRSGLLLLGDRPEKATLGFCSRCPSRPGQLALQSMNFCLRPSFATLPHTALGLRDGGEARLGLTACPMRRSEQCEKTGPEHTSTRSAVAGEALANLLETLPVAAMAEPSMTA